MRHEIFVYGTLKRGFGNHHYLRSAKFIATGRTKNKYALYAAGIPFVVKDNQVTNIIGEIYEVDDATLAIIDSLEGHPDFYKRMQVPIIANDQDQTSIVAWLYFCSEPRGELVPSGIYTRQ